MSAADADDVLATMREHTERTSEILAGLAAKEVTGSSSGGEVVTTLRGDGRFTAITVEPGLSGAGLERAVLEAVNDGMETLRRIGRAEFGVPEA